MELKLVVLDHQGRQMLDVTQVGTLRVIQYWANITVGSCSIL